MFRLRLREDAEDAPHDVLGDTQGVVTFEVLIALFAQAGDAPILIHIETKAGHGAGKPTSKTIEEIADRWAFLVKTLNIKS